MAEYLVSVGFRGWRPIFLGFLLTGLWLLVSIAWTISVFFLGSQLLGVGVSLYMGGLIALSGSRV